MTCHCDSNPAQYERNRTYGSRTRSSGRWWRSIIPSVGLCLNAFKAVSSLAQGGIDISRSLVSRKAQNNVTLHGDRPLLAGPRTSPVCRTAPSPVVGISLLRQHDAFDHGYRNFDVKTRNSLHTTYVSGGVFNSVEQLIRCDLLRLSPRLGDSSRRLHETNPQVVHVVRGKQHAASGH